MRVRLRFQNSQNKEKVSLSLKRLIRKACRSTLLNEAFHADAEISVTFVDDEEIRRLNAEFRDIDRSTDVLSFPLGEDGEYDINPENGACMLGDVVLSLEHAASQAEQYGHSFEREAAYLTVHSVLHLLGYDHVNDEDEKKVMRSREEQIMKIMKMER